MKYRILLLGALMSLPGYLVFANSLTVDVTGTRGDRGVYIACLWSEDENRGFPNCADGESYRRTVVPVASGAITFDEVPDGRYAVSVVHVEGTDGEVNRQTAGIGLSQIERLRFPPPRFARSAFSVTSDERISITLNYRNR